MKRGWKIFWIICASVAGLGLILCIVGAAMGASLSGIRETYGVDLHYKNGFFYGYNDWDSWDDYKDRDDYEEEDDDTQYVRGSGEDLSNFPGIRDVDMEAAYLQVIVRQCAGDAVLVDTSQLDRRLKDRLVFGQEGGELKIEATDRSVWKKLGRKGAGKVIIELPMDRAMEDVSFEIGAGQLTIEALNSGCLDIDVGAGQATVKQFDVKDLNVKCGAGQVMLNGSVTRKGEIDCSVGEIDMTLAGNQNEFDYELDCGVGELNVGLDSYAGLGSKRRIDNGTGKKMEIECGVGRVNVSFTEEE